ncbi:unnamed protein product [Onchocerca ochengi]|uniref:Moesin/ezrin/radixin homolog 1 n=1 Tax=Onchocerca ochengi TaxID=42157 RepID=A0A182E8F6_ONCOC|nr:unnamed protein product [Onchocerca ochengi]
MDSRKQCQCKVLLLDGTDMNVVIAKNAVGRELYDQVFYALDLEEKDYFGLQFMDHYHVQHWLDPIKRINKQVPIGPPYTFRFRVKFYSSEPNNLREELTRYQFFLQLKQDIQTGRLECPVDTAIELAALALQSELGDYNPAEHTPALISEFRFHPEQDEEMEIAILEKFVTCRLGLTPTGMLVFDGAQKIGLFLWEKIQKLDFKNRKITLVVEEDADQASGQVQLHTFVFNLSSHKACKHLWKCAIEHHTFFRLKYHKPRIAKTSQLFRLEFSSNEILKRGRTEYENIYKDVGRLSRRQSVTFERRPSQRYGPRQSLVNKRIQIRNDFKKHVGASVGLSIPDIISPEESCTAENNDKQAMNSNGTTNNDTEITINGHANPLRINNSFNKNVICDEQINDIKELDKSPSFSRKQYNSAKGELFSKFSNDRIICPGATVFYDSTHSRSTPPQFMDSIKMPEAVDTSSNIAHEPSPRWSESPVSVSSVTPTTQSATNHITRIAISNNNSQIRLTSPSHISLQDTPVTHCPSSNSSSIPSVEHVSSVSTASTNTRQSHIPRNFSGNNSGMKSSELPIPSSITPVSSTYETSPSKTYAGSLIRSPLSSPIKSSPFVVLPEKDFQSSTVINGHSHPIVTNDHSSVPHPSVTDNLQDKISTIPVPTISTALSSSEVIRTDTLTTNDRKPFGQTEYGMRSGESTTVSASRLPEPQSRIPHFRATKSTGSVGIKKPHVSSVSIMQISTGNLEPAGAIGDKAYRSRLPVRSGHTGDSSTTLSETHGSRTLTCDEKTSQSRIPVMASSIHRPQSHTQLTGQMSKHSEIPTIRTTMASTNSRMITDL